MIFDSQRRKSSSPPAGRQHRVSCDRILASHRHRCSPGFCCGACAASAVSWGGKRRRHRPAGHPAPRRAAFPAARAWRPPPQPRHMIPGGAAGGYASQRRQERKTRHTHQQFKQRERRSACPCGAPWAIHWVCLSVLSLSPSNDSRNSVMSSILAGGDCRQSPPLRDTPVARPLACSFRVLPSACPPRRPVGEGATPVQRTPARKSDAGRMVRRMAILSSHSARRRRSQEVLAKVNLVRKTAQASSKTRSGQTPPVVMAPKSPVP